MYSTMCHQYKQYPKVIKNKDENNFTFSFLVAALKVPRSVSTLATVVS